MGGLFILTGKEEMHLAISKAKRAELLSKYVEVLQRTNGFVIVESSGMTVQQVNQLRAKVRDARGQYMVTKNTLLTKALQQLGWPVPDDLLKGPVSVAFGLDNFPGVAKAVLDFTQTRDLEEKIRLKGGLMPDSILNAGKVEIISNLPSLDELRAQLAGLIVQPATGLVSVIQAATGQVINVIHAYVEEKGGEAA